jgi:hypothetical protein
MIPATWQEYQRHLRELLAKQDVAMLDARGWFPDADRFGDALHLNEEGAKQFSRRLGALCGNVRQLGTSVAGNLSPARARGVFPDGIVSPKSWLESCRSPA